MNAGQMREALKVKYPLRFFIPGETEIKIYIGAQFKKEKYHQNKSNNTEGGRGRPSGRGNKRDHQEYDSYILTLVGENITRKPAVIYDKFVRMFTTDMLRMPEDTPKISDGSVDKKKVKSKISSEKTKFKNNVKRRVLFS